MFLTSEVIIWENCINAKECIKIPWPINREYCVSISACVRIIKVDNNFLFELEAFGKKWRYEIISSCHVFYEQGIYRFRICLSPDGSNGVRIVLEGCLGVGGIQKCWTLFAAYPKWFSLSKASDDELRMLGLSSSEMADYRSSKGDKSADELYIVIEDELSEGEIGEALKLS